MPDRPSYLRPFILNILFPALLTIILFVVSIFVIIIPSLEKNLLDKKREMICELSNSAWSLLESFHQQQLNNEITFEKAQEEAIAAVSALRYGEENKDYFWITDMRPYMVVHPYRSDLDGKDLNNFKDPNGKKLFVEFARTVKEQGSGYIDYWWQWKDDSTRIVPKLSYVRGFEPWDWIVGTGIYIEDVRIEINRITRRLIHLSFSIIVIISLILAYIARQTFRIEKQKQIAEFELAESKEKYKSLVEASTEGTLMVMEFRIIFANSTIQNLLGFSEKELTDFSLDELVKLGKNDDDLFSSLLTKDELEEQYEAGFFKKDGSMLETLISISHIDIFGKEGFIIVAKDISSHKKIQEELGESKQKFQVLTETINMGVFRVLLGKKPHFTELNSAGTRILGINEQDITTISLTEFFQDPNEAEIFSNTLLNMGNIKERVVSIKRRDGKSIYLSISAIVIKDDDHNEKFVDGIFEDISEFKKTEMVREEIISELNTSLLYLNQPVKHFAQFYPKIPMHQSIRNAALDMKKNLASAALVISEMGDVIGIVTIDDLWKRVICNEKKLSDPVFEIMSAPVQTISENSLIFEALLVMQQRSIRHLPLADINGNINSMITNKEIIQIQQFSTGLLLHEIQNCKNIEDLIDKSKTLHGVVKNLIENGVRISTITRIISSFSDAVSVKCIEFALQSQGTPPCDFAFIVMGSQGREEQTLSTDQDNIIIFEQTDQPVQDYFIGLAEKINTWLDQAGYQFCKGDVMAKNPKWCASINQWKQYFSHWIHDADPQDLIDISIFFDFRFLFGKQKLSNELRDHVLETSKGKAAFFNHLAKNALLVKPPLNLMGNISTKSSGDEQIEGFDVKHALLPIVDFCRIYTLQNGIRVTNTLQRLSELKDREVINISTFEEIVECYEYLMLLRFKHQVNDLQKNRIPDNIINPKRLTQIEQHTLKKIFIQINSFQKKMSYDFTGVAS